MNFCSTASAAALEKAWYATTLLRLSAELGPERMPAEAALLNCHRLLEKHERLAAGGLAVINGALGDCGLSQHLFIPGAASVRLCVSWLSKPAAVGDALARSR